MFAGEWEYRNKELFRELTMAGKSVKAQKDLNTSAAYRLKTMQDKQDDFMKYVMLHLRLLQMVYTATNNVTRERFVSMNGVDIDYAFKVQKEYKLSIEWKSVDRSALRVFEDELEELSRAFEFVDRGDG